MGSSPPQQKSRRISDQEGSSSICFEGSAQDGNKNDDKPSGELIWIQ